MASTFGWWMIRQSTFSEFDFSQVMARETLIIREEFQLFIAPSVSLCCSSSALLSHRIYIYMLHVWVGGKSRGGRRGKFIGKFGRRWYFWSQPVYREKTGPQHAHTGPVSPQFRFPMADISNARTRMRHRSVRAGTCSSRRQLIKVDVHSGRRRGGRRFHRIAGKV